MNMHIHSLNMPEIKEVDGEGWARGIHLGARFSTCISFGNGQIFFFLIFWRLSHILIPIFAVRCLSF